MPVSTSDLRRVIKARGYKLEYQLSGSNRKGTVQVDCILIL